MTGILIVLAGILIVLAVTGWVGFLVLLSITHKLDTEWQHLCNAYRRELGEPPLFPHVDCELCNPPAGSES